MELAFIDWAIIVAFLLLSLFIGIRYKNKASGSLTDFFLGGRNLPWYIAGISMVATTFAADTPLAVTEMVAQNGISKNWLWWSFLIGGLLTTFFFAKLWRKANILTEPEFIEFRYSGAPARFLRGFKAVYLGIFMNCLVIAWVNLALMSLLTEFFDLSNSMALLYTAGFMILAVVYSSLSGLLGVAITDTVQFFIAMIGVIILAVLVLNSEEVGGISELKANLDPSYFNFFPSPSGVSGEDGASGVSTFVLSIGAFLSFVAIQWWASWYPGAEPGGGGYIAQRMMSTKNEKHAVYATLFFNIGHYCLRPWPWIIVALCAIYLYAPKFAIPDEKMQNNLELLVQGDHGNQEAHEKALFNAFPALPAALQADSTLRTSLMNGATTTAAIYAAYPELKALAATDERIDQSVKFKVAPRLGYVFAMKDFLPTGLKGLLLVAFLAAYLSTISTQINWGASYLVNDLYKRFIKPENKFENEAIAEKDYIRKSRLFSVVIMIIGLAVTPFINSISAVWEFLMGCGAGLGLVLILRWYWWRINATSEIVATFAPFVGYAVGHYMLDDAFGEAFTRNNGTFIFTVLFTTISWLIATFITKPTDTEQLEKFYQRVTPDGSWKPVRAGLKLGPKKSQVRNLMVCWISSIAMTYSILFFIGKLILQEYTEAGVYAAISVLGFVILFTFLKRTNILAE